MIAKRILGSLKRTVQKRVVIVVHVSMSNIIIMVMIILIIITNTITITVIVIAITSITIYIITTFCHYHSVGGVLTGRNTEIGLFSRRNSEILYKLWRISKIEIVADTEIFF